MAEPTTKTILLAEDDRFLSKVLSNKLDREGYTVDVASDGREAVHEARKRIPVLILLDIIMPNMNGFEALEILKGDGTTKDIPVIILTNLGQDSDKEKGKKLGAIEYIVKSDIAIKDLVAKIKKIVDAL